MQGQEEQEINVVTSENSRGVQTTVQTTVTTVDAGVVGYLPPISN